ncbi:hypothetical protein SUGI_0448010 [Cryptomeria japonica]|nr:hypothetical protein SUGI_0448010 [Cryptomeria japonica]
MSTPDRSYYISLYYINDQTIESDEEVQARWKEIIEVGHGDKKHDKDGWYKMNTLSDMEGITTIIWAAPADHAAVNFGQTYGYAGFMPNHPSATRKIVSQKGSIQYFLKVLLHPVTTNTTIAVLKILSKHSTDETYLGQGSISDWVDDPRVKETFQQFHQKLLDIERSIMARNQNPDLKDRCGATKLPCTLLFPKSLNETKTSGLTFTGIHTSVSYER